MILAFQLLYDFSPIHRLLKVASRLSKNSNSKLLVSLSSCPKVYQASKEFILNLRVRCNQIFNGVFVKLNNFKEGQRPIQVRFINIK